MFHNGQFFESFAPGKFRGGQTIFHSANFEASAGASRAVNRIKTRPLHSRGPNNWSIRMEGVLRDLQHIAKVSNWSLYSFALGLLVGLLPAVGESAVVMTLLLSPLAFLAGWRPFDPSAKRILVAPVVYLTTFLALNLYHEGGRVDLSENWLYLVQFPIVAVLFGLFQLPQIRVAPLIKGAIAGIFVAVLILVYDYYTDLNDLSCRAAAFSGNPQWVAGFLVILVSGLYALGQSRLALLGWASLALLVIALVAAGALSGARMAFYTLILLIIGFILFHLFRKQWRNAILLAATLLLGLLLAYAVDQLSHCGFFNRVTAQFTYAPKVLTVISDPDDGFTRQVTQSIAGEPVLAPTGQTAQPADPSATAPLTQEQIDLAQTAFSGATRAVIWRNALDHIRLHPWLGYGYAAESDIANQGVASLVGISHMHNQFLSWMIWGGVIGLGAGLVLLTGLFWRQTNRGLAVIFAVSSGLVMATDSILALTFNLNQFLLLYFFFHKAAFASAADSHISPPTSLRS